MKQETLTEGSKVEIGYTSRTGWNDGWKTMEVEIEEATGKILYLDPGYDIGVQLVLDPDGYLWARDRETGKDGLYGISGEINGEQWSK